MISVPVFPLSTSAKEVLDFCLTFQKLAGFIEVFEQKWRDLGGQVDQMGAAYEATEMVHNQLFGHRRYKDREVFYNARSRHYSKDA